MNLRGPKPKPALERFWPKVDVRSPEECWNWIASKMSFGYGVFWNGERNVKAHRWLYETVLGPIPDGLSLDHLCRNPSCVNPAHLEPVTQVENIRRGMGYSGRNFRKTECKRGHAFTPENTAIMRDSLGRIGRRCRECDNQGRRLRRRRAREVAQQ